VCLQVLDSAVPPFAQHIHDDAPTQLTNVCQITSRHIPAITLQQDIAIVTGAEFIAKDLGMKVDATVVEQLGTARKVGSLPFGSLCALRCSRCVRSNVPPCPSPLTLTPSHVTLQISSSSTATTLIADAASKDEIDMRIAQLKKV
jgi:hypothetical protein